jgi:hypothetical protein
MGQTPATDKISVTFSTPYIRHGYTQCDRFALAVATLDAAKTAGEIYNQEFQDAKSYISSGCEHAQHIAAGKARTEKEQILYKILPSSDPRHDIGYAFGMNQAAKLARRLRKLDLADISFELMDYIVTLEQINEWFQFLKSFKPIIKKGRKPNQNKTEAQIAAENFNTGVCAICGHRQKLEHGAEVMVMHGYQMSEYNHAGYRVGKCFGVGYKPYELSNEANVAFAPVLESHRVAIKKAIATLPKLTTVDINSHKWEGGKRVPVTVTYTKEANPYEFKQEITNRESRLEWELETVDRDIEVNTAMIQNWKLQPLKYGSEAQGDVAPPPAEKKPSTRRRRLTLYSNR